MAKPASRHWVDRCTQHLVEGWSTAPWVDVAVNDGRIARIVPDLKRPDLDAAGIGPGAGFRLVLPQPLWLDDELSLHGPDGAVLRVRMGAPPAARVAALTRWFDPARARGLEIGALDRPLIPNGRFRVLRADQASRADLLSRYAGHAVDHDRICEPDYVTGDAALPDLVGETRFGYAVASHVAEHIPDLVGWLWDIWAVLEDGGVLALALPHAAHTFDRHRRLSTMAELADAFFSRLVRPSPRQIIDAMIGSALHNNADIAHETLEAVHVANHARKTGLYVDVHCNVFTPESFVDLLGGLQAAELLGFEVLEVSHLGTDEFFVSLRRDGGRVLPGHISP